MIRKLFQSLVVMGLVVSASTASADTIIKFDLGSTGPDVQYVGGVFSTIADPNGLPGQQTTGVNFTGFLEGVLANIITGASFTIDSVMASGPASLVGPVIVQGTTGGTFSLWDDSNTLLLTGTLGTGAITGATGVDTGSVFSTEVFSFTGGSLLSLVNGTPAGISFALTNILSGGLSGMYTGLDTSGQSLFLLDFTADSSGQITGSPIPEPSTMLLIGSALVGGLVRRRKIAANV
ncbi:MAG TPA: PEP-CTERM sorting domain-containing protein [Oligoflexia bacterium]|nr:PEP-CTERM sorting domain-containing protein [Oligoflexia bacterium]HMP48735.1 PEP-CTERM sorting domain-containing protein [Oligoflexia bacterium]